MFSAAPRLTDKQLDAIRQFDTCRVANAIETFQIRLRNEGFTWPGLQCLFPHLPPILGYAMTGRVRTANPPPQGNSYAERTDWWEAMRSFQGPRIAVVQDLDPRPGLGAVAGEVHAQILRALGCLGLITNGSVRDLGAVAELAFPLFGRGVSVSHSYAHLVDFGGEVEICGLRIKAGDLLYADRHGVIQIPLEIAAEIPAEAARQWRKERAIIELCRSPEFSLRGFGRKFSKFFDDLLTRGM